MQKGEEGNGISVKDLSVGVFDLAEDFYTFENRIWVRCLVGGNVGITGSHVVITRLGL